MSSEIKAKRSYSVTSFKRGVDYAVLPGGARLRCVPQGFGERRGWCPRYMACLDAVESFGWAGFDCSVCPVHEQITTAQQRDEMLGMALLWDAWYELFRTERDSE